MHHFARTCALLIALLALLTPTAALAQQADDQWQEIETKHFAIVFIEQDRQLAERYATFADGIYDEISAIFGHRTGTPLTLRLYPSLERYYEINPMARNMPGIVAHADFELHEVVVIAPQVAGQTEDELANTVRHELTHLVIAELSDNRLNVGLQEGIAQYVEHASPELEVKIRLLRVAAERDQLLTWDQLNQREDVYSSPDISYPQTLSLVAFLVERFSFSKLRDLITTSGRSSGYRSALSRTYNLDPAELERQWREWLPSYLEGGYRRNAVTSYDLSRATLLIEQGRYTEAHEELEAAVEWLSKTDQTEKLAEARALLRRSMEGEHAEQLAQQARDALAAADYTGALVLTQQAQEAFHAIDDRRNDAVLETFEARARRGRHAEELLTQAHTHGQQLRYDESRTAADQAAREFLALGDRERAQQAIELRAFLDQRQTLLGRLMASFGIVGIAAALLRRLLFVRPVEVW